MATNKPQPEILSVVETPPEENQNMIGEAVSEAEDATDSATTSSEPATPSAPAVSPEAPVKKRSFIRRLFTVAFWLGTIAAGIAVLVFVAWPLFDREVLQSVESNAADTEAIEARLDVLEEVGAIRQQSIAALTEAQGSTATDLRETEARIGDDMDQLQADLAEALAAAEVTEDTVATLMTQTAELAETGRSTAVDTQIVTAMELLARARLSLFQANYGLAATDVRLADQVLTGIADPADNVVVATARLDTVSSNLPDRPVLAAADLDIAWQLLLDDVTTPINTAEPAGSTDDTTPG